MAPSIHKSGLAMNNSRPTIDDIQGNSHWVQLAQKYWLKDSRPRRVKQDLVKNEIWDVLESEGFPFRELLILENLQVLEKYVHISP